jgi:hypothetical protein
MVFPHPERLHRFVTRCIRVFPKFFFRHAAVQYVWASRVGVNRIRQPLQYFSGRRYAAALHLLEQNLVFAAIDGCRLYVCLQC